MNSASNYKMTREEMSKHLTPPAKSTTFTPLVTAILAGCAVVAIVFGFALAFTPEPVHYIRRVHVATTP